MRNDIGELVGASCISVVYSSISDAEIRGLWETIVLAREKKSQKFEFVLEGDVLGILSQFMCFITCTRYPLFQNARLLTTHL